MKNAKKWSLTVNPFQSGERVKGSIHAKNRLKNMDLRRKDRHLPVKEDESLLGTGHLPIRSQMFGPSGATKR
jgi:hypothetical protein